jgi:hypothetical protein
MLVWQHRKSDVNRTPTVYDAFPPPPPEFTIVWEPTIEETIAEDTIITEAIVDPSVVEKTFTKDDVALLRGLYSKLDTSGSNAVPAADFKDLAQEVSLSVEEFFGAEVSKSGEKITFHGFLEAMNRH